MKKAIYTAIALGVGMSLLWSLVFVRILGSPAGIGVGVCFGISFAIIGFLFFKGKK